MKQKKGHVVEFTLIELLLVIAIIVLLAGMLLPALKSAKAKARQIECAGNLKSAGLNAGMYASDHNGFIPASRFAPADISWARILRDSGYVKNYTGMHCPSRDYKADWSDYSQMWRVYGRFRDTTPSSANAAAWPTGNDGPIQTYKLASPSKSVIFADSMNIVYGAAYDYYCFFDKIISGENCYIVLIHNGRSNSWFADGHVNSLNGTQLKDSDINGGCGQSGTLITF